MLHNSLRTLGTPSLCGGSLHMIDLGHIQKVGTGRSGLVGTEGHQGV